jgi:hypothetical protein
MDKLVIPSNIPWSEVKGDKLEELLYWLLDDMGAKDLQWRKGSAYGYVSDMGRDIEAVFQIPTPDGELESQKWWVQAKGRGRTVEPNAVKGILNNILGRNDVDIVIIATNTHFSNPTRDWTSKWQESHPRPKVRLWSRIELERLLRQHPNVVAHLFPMALSSQGKMQVISSRFWSQHFLSGEKDLSQLWDERQQLRVSWDNVLPLIVAEAANGDLNTRQWATLIDINEFEKLLVLAITNILFLSKRAEDYGVGQKPLLEAISYLVELATIRLDFDRALALFENPWKFTNSGAVPEGFLRYIQSILISRIQDNLREICSSDCHRVDTGEMHSHKLKNFWSRFRLEIPTQAVESLPTESYLVIQDLGAACKAGLSLDKGSSCPLFEELPKGELSREQVRQFLLACRMIIQYRLKEYLGRHPD